MIPLFRMLLCLNLFFALFISTDWCDTKELFELNLLQMLMSLSVQFCISPELLLRLRHGDSFTGADRSDMDRTRLISSVELLPPTERYFNFNDCDLFSISASSLRCRREKEDLMSCSFNRDLSLVLLLSECPWSESLGKASWNINTIFQLLMHYWGKITTKANTKNTGRSIVIRGVAIRLQRPLHFWFSLTIHYFIHIPVNRSQLYKMIFNVQWSISLHRLSLNY